MGWAGEAAMKDAFGVERISKISLGAGRMESLSKVPRKVQMRQLERLRAGKPQVRSTIDQRASALRAGDVEAIPALQHNEFTGKVLNAARKNPGTPVKGHKGVTLRKMPKDTPAGAGAFVLPDPKKNRWYAHAPKDTNKGLSGALLRHEKAHTQVSPKRGAGALLRTKKQRMGEEARADAAGFGKKKYVETDYPNMGSRNYDRVFEKITGKKPVQRTTPRLLRNQLGQGRKQSRDLARQMNSPQMKGMVRRETPKAAEDMMALTRRSPGKKYRYAEKPNLP